MNLAGHIAVAAILSDDPLVHLGSALPDIGAMGRFRLLGSTPLPAVTRGITIHHRTDEAFHGHPWFRGLQDSLQQRLEGTDGMARGTARAVAHVGPELLLDGALLASDAGGPPLGPLVDQGLATIASSMEGLSPLVTKDHDRWVAHLEKVRTWPRPADYDQPGAVAYRLERILAHRPRLRLQAAHLDLVETELSQVNDHISATAHALVVDLAATVAQALEP